MVELGASVAALLGTDLAGLSVFKKLKGGGSSAADVDPEEFGQVATAVVQAGKVRDAMPAVMERHKQEMSVIEFPYILGDGKEPAKKKPARGEVLIRVRAAGLNPIQRKRVPSAAWADLNRTIQSNLADAMGGREEYGGNSTGTSVDAAPAAINSEAQNTGKDAVRIGRDQTPLSEGGKPFKTRKAAGDAKKLQPMMRVVTVPGGYALAEKTPAQLAAEERAAKRLRTPRTSPAGEPVPAHAFIAASGGY